MELGVVKMPRRHVLNGGGRRDRSPAGPEQKRLGEAAEVNSARSRNVAAILALGLTINITNVIPPIKGRDLWVSDCIDFFFV